MGFLDKLLGREKKGDEKEAVVGQGGGDQRAESAEPADVIEQDARAARDRLTVNEREQGGPVNQ